jgi:chromosomal replication initiation ATPase DnaA
MKFVSAQIEDVHHAAIIRRGSISAFLRDAIKEKLKRDEPRPEVSELIDMVEMVYNCPADWQTNRSRKRDYVIPRQLTMYALRTKLGWSLFASGAFFDKDHASAIYAVTLCINSLETKDPLLFPYVFKLNAMFENTQSK